MSEKKKTINVEPYCLETIKDEAGSFTMAFTADNKIVKMKLSRWWIGYIAKQLHDILDKEQNQISSLRKNLRGE